MKVFIECTLRLRIYRHGNPFENSFPRLNSDNFCVTWYECRPWHGVYFCNRGSVCFTSVRSKRSKLSEMVIKVFNLYKVFNVVNSIINWFSQLCRLNCFMLWWILSTICIQIFGDVWRLRTSRARCVDIVHNSCTS